MVNQIFDYIGLKLMIANPWMDTFSVNCVELPIKNGREIQKRVVNFEGFEKEDFSISDVNGTGFYIKINPIFTYGTERQLSSCEKEFLVTVNFRVLYFAINADIERKKIQLENILSNNLRQLSWGEYIGGERQIALSLLKTNTDAGAIFKEETGLELESGAEAIFIALDCKMTFLSTNENCETECGISTSESIVSGLNFCLDDIFNSLTVKQKECLTLKLCDNMAYKKIILSSGVVDGVNTVFTFAELPIQVFLDGQLLTLGETYTLVGNIVTFIDAPFLGAFVSAYGNY